MSGYDELAKRLRNPALIATREECASAIEALQSEVERLKGVLGEIVAHYPAGVNPYLDQLISEARKT